jgi:hypothetical protein
MPYLPKWLWYKFDVASACVYDEATPGIQAGKPLNNVAGCEGK